MTGGASPGGGQDRETLASRSPSRPSPRVHLSRAVEAPGLVERFFVAAVVAVLLIRAWLAATGYPQIGGHGLHIAHMLFGGAGMLTALLIGLTLLGSHARVVAAVIGGAGFGAFIDELGKFITSDNDYFFQPAVSLIYVIFVLVFIAGEHLAAGGRPTPTARLAQATNVITGAVVAGFPARDRDRALQLLAQSDPTDPLVPALRGALTRTAATPDPAPSLAERLAARAADRYFRLVAQHGFLRLVLIIAGLASLFNLGELAVILLTDPENGKVEVLLDSTAGLLLAANLVAGVLLLAGLLHLGGSRLTAYIWFRRAVLVSLLAAQPLAFYEQQWAALLGLALNLILLSTLNFGITRESALAATASGLPG